MSPLMAPRVFSLRCSPRIPNDHSARRDGRRVAICNARTAAQTASCRTCRANATSSMKLSCLVTVRLHISRAFDSKLDQVGEEIRQSWEVVGTLLTQKTGQSKGGSPYVALSEFLIRS